MVHFQASQVGYSPVAKQCAYCLAYRNVAQHELMGSHEVFDQIIEYICIDVRMIRGTIEC